MQTVTILYQNSQVTFTDSFVDDEVSTIQYSDYAYEVLDSEDVVERVSRDMMKRDGTVLYSDDGRAFIFSDDLVTDILEDVDDWGYAERISESDGQYVL